MWGYGSNRHWGHKTKRLGLGLSHKALSRSALPQVLLNHRIEPSLFRRNGTAVPDGITLRPYHDALWVLTRIRRWHSESGDKAQVCVSGKHA